MGEKTLGRLKIENLSSDLGDASKEMEDMYEDEKKNRNNFSYWFNKIICNDVIREFLIPKSTIVQIPFHIWSIFELDAVSVEMDKLQNFVNTSLIPKMGSQYQYFVKNACFSDKFSYNNCVTNKLRILDSFTSICYSALCLGANGNTEFIIRDYIGYDYKKYATIYSGLPLRCEIRVFYDADKKQLLYPVNYWDYDYVFPNLRERTDQIVFKTIWPELQETYKKYEDIVCSKVEKAFKTVDLDGKWSIDIMIDESNDWPSFYLIDMATAETSAYWKYHTNDIE